MRKTDRLQLRVDQNLKKAAERIAKKKKRSLSFLVEQYLRLLVEEDRKVVIDDNGVRQI